MKFYIISLNKFNTLFNFIQILIHKIYLLSLNLIILINYKVVIFNLSLLKYYYVIINYVLVNKYINNQYKTFCIKI